jgi:hypothetical protein
MRLYNFLMSQELDLLVLPVEGVLLGLLMEEEYFVLPSLLGGERL